MATEEKSQKNIHYIHIHTYIQFTYTYYIHNKYAIRKNESKMIV